MSGRRGMATPALPADSIESMIRAIVADDRWIERAQMANDLRAALQARGVDLVAGRAALKEKAND